MTVSIIICGLVRDLEKFKEKVDQFVDWQERGFVLDIIYATWIGEIDRYDGLRNYITVSKITLIEIEEPKLVLKGGHQLHQMLALHYGLAAAKGDYIMKTRVDLADSNEVMFEAFKNGTELAVDFLGVGLQKKILIESARMELPFLCTDAQFFGHKSDIKKLVSLSNKYELLYNNLAVEQTFFFNPFSEIGLFKRHFYWNLPHFSEININRYDQYEFILETPEILDVIYSWWIVLENYFQIGWQRLESSSESFSTVMGAFKLDSIEKSISKGDGSGVIISSAFVSGLLNLVGKKDALRLMQNMRESDYISPTEIPDNIFNAYERYRINYSKLTSPKACSASSSNKCIKGVVQHFFVKDDNDKASTRYHEQITHLRREIDALQLELNVIRTNTLLHRLLAKIIPKSQKDNLRKKYPRLIAFYVANFMKKNVKQ